MILEWYNKNFLGQTYIDLVKLEKEFNEVGFDFRLIDFFQMAKLNSDVSFVIFCLKFKKELINTQLNFYPAIILNERRGSKKLDYFPAFRDLEWFEYTKNDSKSLKPSESLLINIAVLVLAIKSTAIEKAIEYTLNRKQGGRLLFDWSEVKVRIFDLNVTNKVQIQLLGQFNLSCAFTVLEGADLFISNVMQLMGGVAYMEDYLIEKSFREILFLKNYLAPFSALKQEFFKEACLP
jgi:hypothetical protein